MNFFFSSHTSISRVGVAGVLFAFAAAAPLVRACSQCGCSLSSDWSAQGYPNLPGFSAALRFEYYRSDDLRSGTHAVDRSALGVPPETEVQQQTFDRNTWLGLDYVGAHGWAVSAQVPYHARFHSTLAEGDTEISESRAAGLGDVRVSARYQKYSLTQSYGFQFGLRLPTGRFDQNFAAGPEAGTPLDRGLQLGSGTTDVLLGASCFRRASVHLGWFAQATADQPLAERAGFVPSTVIAVNGGVRYLNTTRVTPQLQLNLRWESREHGANADAANSGGTLAYLSPGLTFETGARSSAFAFVQLPVYRRFNGLQLAPHALVAVGLTWRL